MGSPELVIEVKSPSNTKDELHDRAMTTLAGDGAVEFWIVDPKLHRCGVQQDSRRSPLPDAGNAAGALHGSLDSLDRLFAAI